MDRDKKNGLLISGLVCGGIFVTWLMVSLFHSDVGDHAQALGSLIGAILGVMGAYGAAIWTFRRQENKEKLAEIQSSGAVFIILDRRISAFERLVRDLDDIGISSDNKGTFSGKIAVDLIKVGSMTWASKVSIVAPIGPKGLAPFLSEFEACLLQSDLERRAGMSRFWSVRPRDENKSDPGALKARGAANIAQVHLGCSAICSAIHSLRVGIRSLELLDLIPAYKEELELKAVKLEELEEKMSYYCNLFKEIKADDSGDAHIEWAVPPVEEGAD